VTLSQTRKSEVVHRKGKAYFLGICRGGGEGAEEKGRKKGCGRRERGDTLRDGLAFRPGGRANGVCGLRV